MKTCLLYIDGQWVEAQDRQTFDDLNPATGEIYARVAKASPLDTLSAIGAACRAKTLWASKSAVERETILLAAADVMSSSIDEIATVLIDETGAIAVKARYEVEAAIDILRAAAGQCRRIVGDVLAPTIPGQLSMVVRHPVGVVAAISPFNFPLLLAMKKVAFALAAGNTVVLKPASNTPVVGVKIAETFEKAGLPAGTFNLICGAGGDIGDILVTDDRVDLVSFTGSTAVGARIAELAAIHLKRYTLELGGKNAMIVLEDADLDHAAAAANFGAFFHQGQICIATSKILVVKSVFDDFVDRLRNRAQTLKTGDPRDPTVTVGPLIHPTQSEIIEEQIEDALEKGAQIAFGGDHEGPFFEPTILTGVTPAMAIFHEESFGPVVSVIGVETPDEAVALTNQSIYGLSASIMTTDLATAFDIAGKLEVGMVHINDTTALDDPMTAFGGVKSSGTGREGGRYSIDAFTEYRWITVQTKPRSFPI